jgi:hypothetical protein
MSPLAASTRSRNPSGRVRRDQPIPRADRAADGLGGSTIARLGRRPRVWRGERCAHKQAMRTAKGVNETDRLPLRSVPSPDGLPLARIQRFNDTAGTPTYVAYPGRERTTVQPAPRTTWGPIVSPGITIEPVPSSAPSSTRTLPPRCVSG